MVYKRETIEENALKDLFFRARLNFAENHFYGNFIGKVSSQLEYWLGKYFFVTDFKWLL